jgi:hypothetical protein
MSRAKLQKIILIFIHFVTLVEMDFIFIVGEHDYINYDNNLKIQHSKYFMCYS